MSRISNKGHRKPAAHVPDSCCKSYVFSQTSAKSQQISALEADLESPSLCGFSYWHNTTKIYTHGCLERLQVTVWDNFRTVAVLIISISLIEFIGVLLSCSLWSHTKKTPYNAQCRQRAAHHSLARKLRKAKEAGLATLSVHPYKTDHACAKWTPL